MPRKIQRPGPPAEPRNVTPTPVDPLDIDPTLELVDQIVLIKQRFPDIYRAQIQKMNKENSDWAFCGAMAEDLCTEEEIQKRWRGGRYRIRFQDSKGRFRHQVNNLYIGDPVGDDGKELPEPLAVPPQTALATISSPLLDIVNVMREDAARNQQLMLEMIRSNASARADSGGGATDIVQLVTALASLQNMIPKPQASLPETLTLKMFDMLSNQQSTPQGDGSIASEVRMFVVDVLKEVVPQLRKTNPPATPAATPVTPAQQPAADDLDEEEELEPENPLMDSLNDIHERYTDGRSPAAVADLISMVAHGNDEFTAGMKDILNGGVDKLVDIDPRLKDLKYRQWFDSLFEVLRVQFLGSAVDPVRATGS